jgi:hypothetical protein
MLGSGLQRVYLARAIEILVGQAGNAMRAVVHAALPVTQSQCGVVVCLMRNPRDSVGKGHSLMKVVEFEVARDAG